nr:hypothetical protein [Tanacetum cinerariifolium]
MFNSLVSEMRVMIGENVDDWMTRVEILYKSVTGRVTDEKLEFFGDDQLLPPPDKQRIAKSQRSTNSSASFGLYTKMFQEMLQQQHELDHAAKMEHMDREMAARVDLINFQKVAEDLRILQIDAQGMHPVDVTIINTQKARIRALYQPQN